MRSTPGTAECSPLSMPMTAAERCVASQIWRTGDHLTRTSRRSNETCTPESTKSLTSVVNVADVTSEKSWTAGQPRYSEDQFYTSKLARSFGLLPKRKQSDDTEKSAFRRRSQSTWLYHTAGLSSGCVLLFMFPGIELRTMRYIVAVGSELHFSRAAERVHVAQPSLSKQIRNVEEELGVELFKRTRKRVEITEPGQAFIENAKQALLYADRAASMARAANVGEQGKLFLGVSPSVDLQLYFRLRDAFRKRYDEVEVQFANSFA